MTYTIGQAVPATQPQPLFGHAIDAPAWYAVLCRPQREARAHDALTGFGVSIVYPTEERTRTRNGKAVTTSVPSIPRLLFMKTRYAPLWHNMKARNIITGVLSRGNAPIRLQPDHIRAVMGIPTEAERIAAEVAEALRIHAGQRAILTTGAFAGYCVDVTAVGLDRASWTLGLVTGSTALTDMRRSA